MSKFFSSNKNISLKNRIFTSTFEDPNELGAKLIRIIKKKIAITRRS